MHLIHDLRIVLIALAACLEASKKAAGGRPLPRELDHAARLLETALSIADDLLVSSSLRPPASLVDVNALIMELERVVASVVGADITVRTRLDAPESRIHAHRVDLDRVLLNVVTNAAAALRTGGDLLIETDAVTAEPGERWTDPLSPFGTLRLTIRDNGRGMLPRELGSVINPMARPRPDGSGLGLASVALILVRLGGTFEIDSRPGRGTIVTILLPLSPQGSQIH